MTLQKLLTRHCATVSQLAESNRSLNWVEKSFGTFYLREGLIAEFTEHGDHNIQDYFSLHNMEDEFNLIFSIMSILFKYLLKTKASNTRFEFLPSFCYIHKNESPGWSCQLDKSWLTAITSIQMQALCRYSDSPGYNADSSMHVVQHRWKSDRFLPYGPWGWMTENYRWLWQNKGLVRKTQNKMYAKAELLPTVIN